MILIKMIIEITIFGLENNNELYNSYMLYDYNENHSYNAAADDDDDYDDDDNDDDA